MMSNSPDPARSRFLILTVMRFAAAILVMLGILLAYDRVSWVDPAISAPLGYVLIAVGIADLLLVVPMLARRWRSEGSEPKP
jgi:hypothetical protein